MARGSLFYFNTLTYFGPMQTLLLLHGAIGSKTQLERLTTILKGSYDVHTLDFSGHGGRDLPEEPFSIPLFAADVLHYMEERKLKQISIFGYSMGGYVGMYLAKQYPHIVNKIATMATKYHWDESVAAKEQQMLDPNKIEAKIPAFAQTLKERHAPQDWKQVLERTAGMMQALGQTNTLQLQDYKNITQPSLIMLGDSDKMVSLEETRDVYNSLPNAQLAVLPNTAHPIEQADIDILCYFLKRFFE